MATYVQNLTPGDMIGDMINIKLLILRIVRNFDKYRVSIKYYDLIHNKLYDVMYYTGTTFHHNLKIINAPNL